MTNQSYIYKSGSYKIVISNTQSVSNKNKKRGDFAPATRTPFFIFITYTRGFRQSLFRCSRSNLLIIHNE